MVLCSITCGWAVLRFHSFFILISSLNVFTSYIFCGLVEMGWKIKFAMIPFCVFQSFLAFVHAVDGYWWPCPVVSQCIFVVDWCFPTSLSHWVTISAVTFAALLSPWVPASDGSPRPPRSTAGCCRPGLWWGSSLCAAVTDGCCGVPLAVGHWLRTRNHHQPPRPFCFSAWIWNSWAVRLTADERVFQYWKTRSDSDWSSFFFLYPACALCYSQQR